MRKFLLALLASVALALPCVAWAGSFANSLWVGTDNTTGLPVLNIDRAGNELRRVGLTEATGIAIDPALGRIYFGIGTGGQITGRNLSAPATTVVTLNPAVTFGEDMAFDGAFLWQADISARLVQKIDPSSGTVVFSFDPGFSPLGVAWDGANLWVSEFVHDGRVVQFTAAGVPTGSEFVATIDNTVGGLAFDPTDNTLWIGAFDKVFHFTTAGAALGSIDVPGRFIDGLEFQQGDCLVPATNSLWVGTDNSTGLPVLNIDRAGNELRRVGLTEATGIAIDPALGRIYFGIGTGGQITGRNLSAPATTVVTLNPAVTFGEDMAFDGAFLWQADISARLVQKIDPSSGTVVFSFDPGFSPLGVAWDGANLWVSEFVHDGRVVQFTAAGVPTGSEFVATIDNTVGGLAFDPTDNTLWIGAFDKVFHFTTAGAALGSIDVPGRFIDGLEFQQTGCAIPAGVIPGPSRIPFTNIHAEPNPFRLRTSVRFTLTVAQQTEAGIYDIRGQLVRILRTGRLEAGSHEFEWDSRDGRGNLVGSGIYFIRVSSGEVHLAAKVVRVQ